MGELIDEGFNGKRIGTILDCAPGPTEDGKIGHEEFDVQVRYLILNPGVPVWSIRHIPEAPQAIIINSVFDGIGIDGLHDRDSGGLVIPADQLTLSVKATLNSVSHGSAKPVVSDIIFSCPHPLD